MRHLRQRRSRLRWLLRPADSAHRDGPRSRRHRRRGGGGGNAVAPGDRVTFDSTVYCAECDFCLRGEVNLCEDRQVIGVSCGEYRRAGAFAEYIAVPEYIVYKLPPSLSFADAAMLEAVSVALHAVKLSQIEGGETALVIGAGMIGLLVLQAARAAGCSRVIVADVDATRLKMARRWVRRDAPCLRAPNSIREVLRLTNGRGVDVVFEAVGRSETVVTAIDCVRKGGTVTLIGNIAAAGSDSAAKGRDPPDSPAGIVRLCRRIS